MVFCRDKVHADWVKAWFSTLRELQGYIKAHHTTGLTWNRQVGDFLFPVLCT